MEEPDEVGRTCEDVVIVMMVENRRGVMVDGMYVNVGCWNEFSNTVV